MAAVGQDTWEWILSAFEIAFDSSLTHTSKATLLGMSGFDGSPASGLVWNLGQSLIFKSG